MEYLDFSSVSITVDLDQCGSRIMPYLTLNPGAATPQRLQGEGRPPLSDSRQLLLLSLKRRQRARRWAA